MSKLFILISILFANHLFALAPKTKIKDLKTSRSCGGILSPSLFKMANNIRFKNDFKIEELNYRSSGNYQCRLFAPRLNMGSTIQKRHSYCIRSFFSMDGGRGLNIRFYNRMRSPGQFTIDCDNLSVNDTVDDLEKAFGYIFKIY
jgi:hypothetical protein